MHTKLLSFILSVAMLFSFATPVFAAEPPATPPIVTEQSTVADEHTHDAPLTEEHQGEEKPPEETPPAEPPAQTPPPTIGESSSPLTEESSSEASNATGGSPAPVVDSGIPPGISDVEIPPLTEPPAEAPEYTIVELKNGESIVVMGVLDSGGSGIAPRIVGSRQCVFRDCTNYVTVNSKYDYVCNAHKCGISGCSNPLYNQNPNRCQSHAGITSPICQVYTPENASNLCGKPSVGSNSIACWEHHCPGCLGIGSGNATICYICMQCWVPGCPNSSTCTNECDAHCPHNCKTHHQNHCLVCHGRGGCCSCNTCAHNCKVHHQTHCLTCHGKGNCCACNTCAHTCKTHHQNHCLTCHAVPCVCYPLNPVINVGGWNSGDNSVTVSISSTRATQIEIYSAGNQLVNTMVGASGNYVFRYNAAHNNGRYYVRVKNASGYNPANFPFTVSGLDRAAPAFHTVASLSSWASSKTLIVTASDQTNVRFTLQYADGTPVPYCTEKEGTASGGKFTTSWTITEQITSPKGFRLVTTDRWGYSSSYDFTVNQIDTTKPTAPTITKSTEKQWHNSTVTGSISGSSAPSGIAGYEYRINGGTWQSGDDFSLSAQGQYTVEARAVSNAGLDSDTVSTTVKIDTTKPSGTFTLSHSSDRWTTDAVTINFIPSDLGGSGVQAVTMPNGEVKTDIGSIVYTASQNGSYVFTITDNAGNSGTVIVPVEFIAMLDVTVTLNTPFVISPDADKVYGGDIRFSNHSNVPVRISVERMEPQNGAPAIVSPDSQSWKNLSAQDTKRYVALGFTGNGEDFWLDGGSQPLGEVAKNSAASFAMKARHGYAWENPQALLYAMTVKVAIDQ